MATKNPWSEKISASYHEIWIIDWLRGDNQMFRKSVFYLDLPIDHREGANDNAFGTALRFQRLLQYPSGLINVVWTPSVQLNVAHPRNCALNMYLLIVFLCSMYNYDITKYLESLEIKNNFLSGLLSMQPPTREIIGEKPNQCTHNRLTMRLTELNICLICVVDMWFNYKKLCLLFMFSE